MSKNSQRLQALRHRGNTMYREGQADGKVGVPHRYHHLDSQFHRYRIGYIHGAGKAYRRKPKTMWQKFKDWFFTLQF